MNEKSVCKLTRGSLTVEAACLAPILFVSVFLLLYLTAHVHNRTCLYTGAAEQAVSGHEQEDPSLFALTELSASRNESDSQRTVAYKAGTLYIDGERKWSIDEEAVYKKYQPAKRLRQIAAGKRAIHLDE